MRTAVYLAIFLYFLRRLFRRLLTPPVKFPGKPGKKHPHHMNVYRLDEECRVCGKFYRIGGPLLIDDRTCAAAEQMLEKDFSREWDILGGWTVGIGTDFSSDGTWRELTAKIPEKDRARYFKLCAKMINAVDTVIERCENA